MVQQAGDTLRATVSALEALMLRAPDWPLSSDHIDKLADELRRLHARVRTHHAAGQLASCELSLDSLAPEYLDEFHRLQGEYPHILGMLDRLIRAVDAIADRSFEDGDVFMARVRELVAVLRRHEAEEDRLFYLAVWRDTGGES